MERTKKYKGRVIFYNKDKGFGQTENPELGNVYLHYTKMIDDYCIGHANDIVEFDAFLYFYKKCFKKRYS